MAADAPWCTLCLAPRPAPKSEPVVVAAASASSLYPVITAARLGRPATGEGGHDGGAQDASAEAAERTWPCVTCGTAVAMDADRCPECGAGFLGVLAVAAPSLRVPVIGVDLAQRGKGTTYAVAVGLGLLVAALLVGLVLLLAAIF